MKKKKLAIFLSGHGSNFEAIADACDQGEIDALISVVFSNKEDARGIERAKQRGLDTLTIPHFNPRERFDSKVIGSLDYFGYDLIVLCGYMRILSPLFLELAHAKVINIHPSLLPAYRGINAVQKAFDAGEKRIGVTVHYVDEGVDTGSIILQETVDIDPQDTLDKVMQKVHLLEHSVYKKAIAKVILEGHADT